MSLRLTKKGKILFFLTLGVVSLGVLLTSFLYLRNGNFRFGQDPAIAYGPVLGDVSGGNYSIMWVTHEPHLSSIKFASGKAEASEPTKYHYYKINSASVTENEQIVLKHGSEEIDRMRLNDVKKPFVEPQLPFAGYGEIEGLADGQAFVIVEIGDKQFVSLVSDGRWSIDFPKEISKNDKGVIKVVKDKLEFETDIDLSLVQPAQTIVLNKTKDRISAQSTSMNNRPDLINGLISDVYACEGDVSDWTVTCPDGTTHTESDKCTQEVFMDTHQNGYDQWAYEACKCPLEGETWEVECNDGTTYEEADMCAHDLFYRVHSTEGYAQWQTEACQDHGGPKELREEQDGAWNRRDFEKTPPTVVNQKRQPKSTSAPEPEGSSAKPEPETVSDPYICCWGDNGGSYTGAVEDLPTCIGGTHQIGTAKTVNGCDAQFSQSEEEIKKKIEPPAKEPEPAPKPETPYDPALATNDLRSYNPNYPSKEDSLSRLCNNFPESVLYWSQNIVYWADVYGIDPNMLATVMSVESCGNPTALSGAGATSLYQVVPRWHFKDGDDPWDPDTNARAGAKYISSGYKNNGNDPVKAFAGYNMGYGRVVNPQSTWPSETQSYIKLTMGLYNDALNCGSSSSGTDYFMSQRRYGCEAAMDVLEQNPQGGRTSKLNNDCYEPDKRGRCSNVACDDKIGESCSKEPDSCVFGGICIAGKCEHYPESGCIAYETDAAYEERIDAAGSPDTNDQPVEVVGRGGSPSEYPKIEYKATKGTSYEDIKTKFPHEYVVLHWSGGSEVQTAEDVVASYENMKTSANYVVSRTGVLHYVYKVGQTIINTPDQYINANSLSFENVGTGGESWSTLTYSQAMANVQEIKRHIDEGNLVRASQLKVIGNFEVKDDTGSNDPGSDFVAMVCAQLHEDGYKVKCNWGVDLKYKISDPRVAQVEEEDSVKQFALIPRAYAQDQIEGYAGPGMYQIEFNDYQLQSVSIYLQKDLDDTTFFEDINGNNEYDPAEDLDLSNSITSVRKISNEIVVDLTNYVNFVSFPTLPSGVSSAQELVDLINHQAGDVQSISRLHNGEWQTFVVREGEIYSEDFELRENEPYYIKLLYQTTLFVDGKPVDGNPQNVVEGWNPIVVYNTGGSLKGSDIEILYNGKYQIDSVFYWDGGKYVGISFNDGEIFGEDFVLQDGEAYWVRVK